MFCQVFTYFENALQHRKIRSQQHQLFTSQRCHNNHTLIAPTKYIALDLLRKHIQCTNHFNFYFALNLMIFFCAKMKFNFYFAIYFGRFTKKIQIKIRFKNIPLFQYSSVEHCPTLHLMRFLSITSVQCVCSPVRCLLSSYVRSNDWKTTVNVNTTHVSTT